MIKAELQCRRPTRKTLLKIYMRIENGDYMRPARLTQGDTNAPATDSPEA